MKQVSVAIGGLAMAMLCLHAGEAKADCNGALAVEKLVIIPITPANTPSSAVMPRNKIISEAKILRDWYEEVSGGCYVPDIWVDAMQSLPQPVATYCNPTCQRGTLADATHQVAMGRYPIYGSQPSTRYIKLVMGAPDDIFDASLVTTPTSSFSLNYNLLYHELGHAIFGLNDAGGMVCTDATRPFGPTPWLPNIDTSACPISRYGTGKRTPMGSHANHYTALEKYTVGFLTPSQVAFYVRTTSNQTRNVRLYSASKMNGTTPQLIRIRLGSSTGPFYWIEYRTRVGFDASVDHRVNVYWDPEPTGSNGNGTPANLQTLFYFRDFRPASEANPLQPSSFQDAATGITVTPGAYNDDWVDLTIKIPAS